MKTKKPYRDFPLFLHATGQYAKKVRGRMIYFGVNPDAALAKWLKDKDHLLAGHAPPQHPGGLTVRELCNRFLEAKKTLLDTGDLAPRSWSDYYRSCKDLIEAFGKDTMVTALGHADFAKLNAAFAERFGVVSRGIAIQRTRTVFKFAFESKLIDKPVWFGTAFKKPTLKAMRVARHAAGTKLLEADELRKIINAAGPQMKAMILLGLNAGFGASDLSSLPRAALDLEGGWVNFPRVKTAVQRRVPLWPETVAALGVAIPARPDPRDDADAELVFLTKQGRRWVRMKKLMDDEGREKAGNASDAAGAEFRKLLTALKVKRPGLGFYALRHTFRTVADRSKDQPAIDFMMGHIRNDMASLYRERIDDDRLQAVAETVRKWLWPG